jgi:hypothetical protein
VCGHEIRNIHCACQDADDFTHFAYITKDHASKIHYCHVFCVQTMVRGHLLPSICTVLLPDCKMLFPVVVTNSTDRVHLEKLTVPQLIMKFSACYENRMFITVFTKARYWTLSSPHPSTVFFKILCNIIRPYTSSSSNWALSLKSEA